MSERDYKLTMIFDLMLEKLVEISIGENVIREINERRSRVFDKEKTDSYFFEVLVKDIHNAGMKAALVTRKMPFIKEAFSNFDINKVAEYDESDLKSLLSNTKIIRNKTKLIGCIKNAKIMKLYSQNFGSFGAFLDEKKDSIEELKELLLEFPSVGPAVTLDFLKDIGMNFAKPDVHVLRIFYRLGLIKSETCFNDALKVVTEFSNATSEKLSVVDAVFWMYGGGGDGHIGKAMCNKNNPHCSECPLTNFCSLYKDLFCR
jgi:endonuclease III